MVNQFAHIQAKDFEGLPHQIGELNDAAIIAALQKSDVVVLAWGSSNRFEVRKPFVHGLLGDMKQQTLLQTKMHPSRGRYDGFIQLYLFIWIPIFASHIDASIAKIGPPNSYEVQP